MNRLTSNPLPYPIAKTMERILCVITLALSLHVFSSITVQAQEPSEDVPAVPEGSDPSAQEKDKPNVQDPDPSDPADNEPGNAKPDEKMDQEDTDKKDSNTDKDDAKSEAEPSKLIQYGEYRTEELVLGMKLTASTGLCKEIFATIPMPMEYPEQKVRVTSTNFPATARYYVRPLTETVQQLVITMPAVAPNSVVEATVRIEVQKAKILGPTDPEALVIPKKIPRNFASFMGPSPLIETNDAKIRKIAREIAATNPPNAWAHVEKIYDYVREAINYREGKAKSVLDALKDKEGDCEEMSGAFVAICRASKIPARCVWVHGHAYPEFYLEDKDGNGCWFPCQVAGTRQFGSMDEMRPILQKGDRFKVPEKTQPQRYVAEYLKVKSVVGGDGPDVEWIRNVK